MRYIYSIIVQLCIVLGLQAKTPEITVEMRPLVRVRDSVITVVDVMKKMDLVFYQQYPQYRSSPEHRLEFYKSNFRLALQDLVEKRVLMLFAEENKMDVGHGDVREEMEELFGPNVLLKLYEAGVSQDDAYDMVRQEIMMRRILQFYVRMPAMSSVTPQKVQERFIEKYGAVTCKDKLVWQILSLRAPDHVHAETLFKSIVDSLNQHECSLEEARKKVPKDSELILSSEYVTEVEKLSPLVKQIVEKAPFHVWTVPQQAKESQKGWQKWSSYLVSQRIAGEKVPLNLVENEIVDELMQPIFVAKKKSFMDGLMQKYDVVYLVSDKDLETLQPFSLHR